MQAALIPEIAKAIAVAIPIVAGGVVEAPVLLGVCVGGALVLASVWLASKILRPSEA
jgi:hypothetical protein